MRHLNTTLSTETISGWDGVRLSKGDTTQRLLHAERAMAGDMHSAGTGVPSREILLDAKPVSDSAKSPDSEIRRGQANRYNTGKADYSLIPMHLLEGEARVWMHGEKKYSRWQWTKGMLWSKVFASLMRHLFAWQTGEELDSESGLSHLDHAICNIRMLQLYRTEYPEGDDRRKSNDTAQKALDNPGHTDQAGCRYESY